MKMTKIDGKNKKHRVLMYALSTCAWCKKTKKFLKDSGVEYEFVDVDLCSEEDRDKIRQDIIRHGGSLSYPTIIVDDKQVITGYDEAQIKEALEI
jgi:glutaredoxin